METKHLHDQIARATARLAQMKARDLLAQQRLEARQREATRKRAAQRRNHYGQLVISAGGEDLAEGEIVAALLIYQESHRSAEDRGRARSQGEAHLAARAADNAAQRH